MKAGKMIKLRLRSALRCSFCGKDDSQVEKLIAGPSVYICNACVGLCNDILEGKPASNFPDPDTLSDDEILTSLPYFNEKIEVARNLLQERVCILQGRGISWNAIGAALGISRQAAWERFSSTDKSVDPDIVRP